MLLNVVCAIPSGFARWKNPCGVTTLIDPNDHTTPLEPVQIIKDMLIRIREGKDLSSGYQEKLVRIRMCFVFVTY